MDNQDQVPQENNLDHTSALVEFSTIRRVVTALLVLVAALLLGYVLYDVFSHNSQVPEPQLPDTVTDQEIQEIEYIEEEKQVILESMNSTESQSPVSVAEENDRQIVIDAMNTDIPSDSDVSEEDRIMLLNQMQ